jgi:ribosomal protein S18 acetylase RimI-like enzyme
VASTAEVDYVTELSGIAADDLIGFFVGWPTPPSPERHLELLYGSDHVVLARLRSGRVVGFVTAISDGVLSAFIPFLEVLPDFQRRGIGTELVRRLLDRLGGLYMVDVTCDAELESFYRRLGMRVLPRSLGLRSPENLVERFAKPSY